MVSRIYVEKKPQFNGSAAKLERDIFELFGIKCEGLRKLIRYDAEGLDGELFDKAVRSVFSEPTVDDVYTDLSGFDGKILVTEYLDGQFDQRADSAAQCVQLLSGGSRPLIRQANVYVFKGVSDSDLNVIKGYLINKVDSREGTTALPATLVKSYQKQGKMRVTADGFIEMSDEELKAYYGGFGFAMAIEDLRFVQDYFKKQKRNPTLTELKVIDTYWSDHCRHTTFLTELKNVTIHAANPAVSATAKEYTDIFAELYKGRTDKYPCLMDIATIAAKKLKRDGLLKKLDTSDEINACSVEVAVDVNGKTEDWLIMFKNETHNHPTEIEPFGGAATCIGGAIRDPLSGRTYVYQAMRITGAGNVTESADKTIKGKLPQRVLSKTALSGFSSYGNQIGLATGIVKELYNDRYKAKRLETGYVIGGAPKANVVREKPQKGDLVILVGGDTGRDGCGGATGSSKAHTTMSVELCGAEVQKGNAPEERKLQRLFRNKEAASLIIKCNDFGAGGVCVAIGELSDGLDIRLDKVSKKYEGLTATELAISESQERMAVVVKPDSAARFIEIAESENLNATVVATVTDLDKLRMFYGDKTIADIDRSFLDTNGVKQQADATITDNGMGFFARADEKTKALLDQGDCEGALKYELSKLNGCSQKGLGETFDSTIGAATVLMPFGGKYQLTPATIMASKPPVADTTTVTCSSYGIYPDLMMESPFLGSVYSVVSAVTKLVVSGVPRTEIYLTLQEFFKKLYKDADRWGEPLGALLGALNAQLGLKIAAIGGKDSMSGSYEDIDVPPTLICFGMGITKENKIRHNAFGTSGNVYRVALPRNDSGMPVYDELLALYDEIYENIDKIKHSAVVEEGGTLATLAKSLFGNGAGIKLSGVSQEDFLPLYGDMLFVSDAAPVKGAELVGTLNGSGIVSADGKDIALSALCDSFAGTLEKLYPTATSIRGKAENHSYVTKKTYKAECKVASPNVFIPVFPGTNCEYDMIRAFERTGATCRPFVIKNRSDAAIKESVDAVEKLIKCWQIIAFPGGFSGGDEPDGSGKFIATTFRNPRLADAVEELLYKRDGLALGICNGFQALIKLGLLPEGRISYQSENSPTLTYNDIARHVSTIARIRLASNASPWLCGMTVGSVYNVAVSHGEGKVIADAEHVEAFKRNGQIATQYVDLDGNATMTSPFNPNGSVEAIEGLISADGRVLGKMGHTERYQKGLYQNIDGEFYMPIFESGVRYFK